MLHRSRELWYALVAMVLITAMYVGVVTRSGVVPAASNLFGHGLGVAGFVLMLATETLYSLRKRSRLARWGRMSTWLRFHIFTGLVGPYMVLLHTSWKFHGLAGAATALTIVIVFSGIIGRYIYTAIPRTADGAVIEALELDRQMAEVGARLQILTAEVSGLDTALSATQAASLEQPLPAGDGSKQSAAGLVLGKSFLEWEDRLNLWRQERQLEPSARVHVRELNKLLVRRRTLERQVASLATARRALATWHAVHIPIGMALFTVAFAHIGAAVYYATLLK
jgi:hypothetical protein